MPVIVKAPAQGTKVKKGDTLKSLADAAGPDITWKMIARLNWGTDRPIEVVYAILETIGMDLKDLHSKAMREAPETIPFAPHPDLKAELRIPEVYQSEGLDPEKTHVIKVKQLTPATAVGVISLDKWFIPEIEKCEIRYELFGRAAEADKVRMDVFGSNYCDCTDWSDGAGSYDKGELEKEPIYTRTDLKAEEHVDEKIKWTGECTTKKGLLSVKAKDEDTRHVNVAFSPYTVQMTYHKADLPDTDRPQIVLKPFWPAWKMNQTKPAATVEARKGGLLKKSTESKIKWTNPDDQEGGAVEIRDAAGVVVHRQSFTPTLKTAKKDGVETAELELPDALKKGDQKLIWDSKYRPGVVNGAMEGEVIDDSAWSSDMQKQLLYRSTPYTASVVTLKPELKTETLKVEWKVLNSGGKLKRGLYRIKDRTGRIVFIAPLPEAKMKDGEHSVAWDGKYPDGVKNTLGGDEITPWDMPYRVEVQMHTAAGEAEGLALAAEHSEVRLYTHNETFAPDDPRYDPLAAKNTLMLSPGPLLAKAELEGDVDLKPGIAPKDKTKDEWFRFKLAESGFHPGPLHKAYDGDFKISLQEFKRSVPADGSVGAGNFTRLKLDAGNIELRDAAARTALETLRAGDVRIPYADRAKIDANSDNPDLGAEDFAARLRDVTKDVVIWVDDRQYYTDGGGDSTKDADNKPFLTAASGESPTDAAPAARIGLGLNDYRGGMVNGDGRVATDADAIPRPWVPLQAAPALMGREVQLFDAYKKERVEIEGDNRAKMLRAIGPLRMDWVVEELPFDVSTIDPRQYPKRSFDGAQTWDQLTETRTRRYLTWAMWQKKAEHTRADTKRKTVLTNCPADMGGVRPSDPKTYADAAFGSGDQSLWPWKASHDATAEAMSTIIHDHIHKDQAPKDLDKPLVADLVGGACAWFRPSTIGGDGYRVGARMALKKDGANAAFPNIEALAARYPVAPGAHGARMRVWRRSSLRGVACWSPSAGKYNGAMINQFRDYYKPGHVYFVNEGGPLKLHAMSDIFDESNNAHKTRFQNIIHNNLVEAGCTGFFGTKANITLDSKYPHPYSKHFALGFNSWYEESKRGDISKTATNLWNVYNGALLYAVAQAAETNGYMRGHLIAEFVSAPKYNLHAFECGVDANHAWVIARKPGESPPSNLSCPTTGCAGVMTSTGDYTDQQFGFNGIGLAIGVTWCFDQSDANIGVHEVGHHRHFEHCAHAPYVKPDMHDHAANQVVNWTKDGAKRAVWWDAPEHHTAGDPNIADAAAHADHGKRWDRRCVMSYANDAEQYFCGKCALRNRGWKVTSLPAMDGSFREPA